VAWYQSGGGRAGLQVPQAVFDETQEYREDEDAIGRFLSEGCFTPAEIAAKMKSGDLVKDGSSASEVLFSFRAWAEREGETNFAKISANAMGRALRERGYMPNRSSSGKRYSGIVPRELRTSEPSGSGRNGGNYD